MIIRFLQRGRDVMPEPGRHSVALQPGGSLAGGLHLRVFVLGPLVLAGRGLEVEHGADLSASALSPS